MVFQTNPVGVELFSYVNNFFCSHKIDTTLFHTQKSIPSSTPKGLQTTVFGAAHTCIAYAVHTRESLGARYCSSVAVGMAHVIRT